MGSSSGGGTASIRVGRYWLEVGADDGTFAEFEPNQEHENAAALKQAFKRSAAESSQPPGLAAAEDLIRQASSNLGSAEHWVSLFTDLVQGRIDPKSASAEVDAGLQLMGRLDRSGRHEEALRLARDLSAILALLLRWLDLIRSLKFAATTAARLGESAAADHAWALHELGSLQLAAGDPHDAAKNLQNAKTSKDKLPPGNGRCATRHNLDSAHRDIYAIHARYQKLLKLTAAVFVVPLLLTGGVAAAVIIDDQPGPTPIAQQTGSTASGSTSTTNPPGPTSTIHQPPPPPTDTVAPKPTLTAPPETTLTTSTPVFAGEAGTAEGDENTVTLSVNDTNGAQAGATPLTVAANGANGQFRQPVRLGNGNYVAYVTQADNAGKTGTSRTVTFSIDTTGPSLTIDCSKAPKCTGTTSENNQPVTITVGETPIGGSTRTTYKIAADSIPADGTFTATLNQPLDQSQDYDVTATQNDAAGNPGTSSTFNFQTGPG